MVWHSTTVPASRQRLFGRRVSTSNYPSLPSRAVAVANMHAPMPSGLHTQLRPCSTPLPSGASGPHHAGAAITSSSMAPDLHVPAPTARAAATAAPATASGTLPIASPPTGLQRMQHACAAVVAAPPPWSPLLEEQQPRGIPTQGPSLAADRPCRRQRRLPPQFSVACPPLPCSLCFCLSCVGQHVS